MRGGGQEIKGGEEIGGEEKGGEERRVGGGRGQKRMERGADDVREGKRE